MKAIAIHLIEDYGKIVQVNKDDRTFDSGNWYISKDLAQELVDGRVYFHKAQREPSFFGGTILAWREIEEGEDAGRIIFTFRSQADCKNVKTAKSGWGNEKKIVKA